MGDKHKRWGNNPRNRVRLLQLKYVSDLRLEFSQNRVGENNEQKRFMYMCLCMREKEWEREREI